MGPPFGYSLIYSSGVYLGCVSFRLLGPYWFWGLALVPGCVLIPGSGLLRRLCACSGFGCGLTSVCSAPKDSRFAPAKQSHPTRNQRQTPEAYDQYAFPKNKNFPSTTTRRKFYETGGANYRNRQMWPALPRIILMGQFFTRCGFGFRGRVLFPRSVVDSGAGLWCAILFYFAPSDPQLGRRNRNAKTTEPTPNP